jgi:pimeloyl-ACP methyl ester carboxylesterase
MRLCTLLVGGLLWLAANAAFASESPHCFVGAYKNADGRVLSLQSTADDALRFYLLDGRTGVLRRQPDGVTYTAGPGLSESLPVMARARLEACGADSIEFALQNGPDGHWSKVPLEIEDTTFSSGNVRLKGRWVRPAGQQAAPTLVFVHGSGATASIDSVVWQWLLPAEGVGAFVFDKRGTGVSTGEFTQNFEILAQDVDAAVRTVRRLGGGRISRLGVAGFSQGGWIAPLAATQVPVDFVVVGFGVVGSPVDQDVWQVAYQLKQDGFGAAEEAKAAQVTAATGRFMLSNYRRGLDAVNALKAKFAGEPWLDKVDGQYSGIVLQGDIERAKRESPGVIWNYDAMRVLRAVKVPQLWIMGAADSVAPSAPSIERLKILQREHRPIDIAIFPDTDHGIYEFTTGSDGKRHNTRAADGYLRLQIDWIKGHLSEPYGRAELIRHP